jgi:hypothetical protein
MVIRLSFLFSSGEDKERPAVVIVAIIPPIAGEPIRVAVMPITHSSPSDGSAAIEIPPRLKSHLNLDDQRSWVVINEINEFWWPGYDIRPIPGGGGRWEYGQMPPRMITEITQRVMRLEARNRVHLVARD